MPNIFKAVQFMIDLANDDSHGYDQTHRNGPDYDCSSSVGTALHNAGFNVSPYSWTGNLKKQLLACGFTECKAPWKSGDIHLAEGHHVCMSIDQTRIAHASINEKGTTTGGKTGDQTGREICIREYYDYPWNIHLRYVSDEEAGKTVAQLANEVIAGKWGTGETRKKRLTNAGYDYKTVQDYVNYLLLPESQVSLQKVAREVIQGKWGNGTDRKNRLKQVGYSYIVVQQIVNKILNGCE